MIKHDEVQYVDLVTNEFIDNPEETDNPWCYYVDTVEGLEALKPALFDLVDRAPWLGFDIETSKKDGRKIKRNDPIGWETDILSAISLCHGEEVHVIKTSHMEKTSIRPYIEKMAEKPWVGHNIKFDLRFVYRDYRVLPPKVYDTEIAARASEIFKGKRFRLIDVVAEYLGVHLSKEEQISNWGARFITGSQVAYAGRDTYYLPQLVPMLNKKMDEDFRTRSTNELSPYIHIFGCWNKIFHLEMELVLIFTRMEDAGVYMDLATIDKGMLAANQIEGKLIKEFIDLVDDPKMNPRSPVKVLEMLVSKYPRQGYMDEFGKWQPVSALRKKGPKGNGSVAQDDIKPYVGQGMPIIDKLYEYRVLTGNLQRLKEFSVMTNRNDSRIRTSFRLWGAVSGRTSNPKPNLQNVKNKERAGINLRALFVAPPGKKLVVVDYSACQLVICAALTKDPIMMDVIINGPAQGVDLHKKTASIITGIDVHDITKVERKYAKAVNFGLIFGMGAPTLIEYAKTTFDLSFTLEQSKEYRRKFFEEYKAVKRWHEEVSKSQFAGKYPCITMYGRKSLATSFTEATNYPIQGTEADMIKLAMVLIDQEFRKRKFGDRAFLVNMIHDELVAECDENLAEEVKDIIEKKMVQAGDMIIKHIVPVTAEGTICDCWAEGK
jgi:DNA polymerase-1